MKHNAYEFTIPGWRIGRWNENMTWINKRKAWVWVQSYPARKEFNEFGK